MKHLSATLLLMIGWIIVALIPTILLLTDISLFPTIALDSPLAQGLFWITSSGTAPYGVATVVLVLILSYRRLSRSHFFSLILAVSLSMGSTLGLNHQLKPFFKQARPNVVWLEQHYLLNTAEFYLQPEAQRKTLMTAATTQLEYAQINLSLSPRIRQHWQHEVGFAFPSGHTLFAITLTMVVSYYLLMTGGFALPGLLFFWSITMAASRMLLGMHWAQDVLASTVLGGSIGLLSLYAVNKGFPYLQAFYTKIIKSRALKE